MITAGTPAVAAEPAVVTPPDAGFSSWDVGLGRADQIPDPAGKPIRIEISWWAVQGEPAWGYNWSAYDEQIARAAGAGMKILLLITYAPPWSNGHVTTLDDKWFPLPEFDGGWAAFVDATVRRYGDRVRAYEIWNEANHKAFGNYGKDDGERLRRYWELVRLSNATIKAACPACLVVAGGSAGGSTQEPVEPAVKPNPNSPAAWLDWAYRSGFGDDFDAVAHHPYPNWGNKEGPIPVTGCADPDRTLFGPDYVAGLAWRQQCGQLAALRAVLLDHQDGHKQIWGTEWGYPTASANADHPSPASIRDFDVQGVHEWRRRTYLGPLFLYQFQDSCARPTDPECHYGIVDLAGKPKEPLYTDLLAKVADAMPATLPAGGSMRRWQALRSPNGRFVLWLQDDGNLVIYDGGSAIWRASLQPGKLLLNQTDGNLVLYADQDKPLPANAVWASGTDHTAAGPLAMRDDGNLVRTDSAGRVIWASDTRIKDAG